MKRIDNIKYIGFANLENLNQAKLWLQLKALKYYFLGFTLNVLIYQ